MNKSLRNRWILLVVAWTLFVPVAVYSGAVQAVWEAITGHRIEVAGDPVAATLPKLSEHNIGWVGTQPPQEQAEFLLSAAILLTFCLFARRRLRFSPLEHAQ